MEHINLSLVLGCIGLTLFLAFKLVAWGHSRWLGSFGYCKKKLLTGNELEFYRRLSTACAGKFVVLPQVAMGAIMDTTLKTTNPRFWEARSKFSQKIVDFCLCEPRTMEVIFLVELDDRTHVKEKDAARDAVTHLAGYRTLRYHSKSKPSVEELKEHISKEQYLLS